MSQQTENWREVAEHICEPFPIRGPKFFKALAKVNICREGALPESVPQEKSLEATPIAPKVLQTPYSKIGFGDVEVILFDLYREIGSLRGIEKFETKAGLNFAWLLPEDLAKLLFLEAGNYVEIRERFLAAVKEREGKNGNSAGTV